LWGPTSAIDYYTWRWDKSQNKVETVEKQI
jgi:hypothetical protein